MEASVKAAKIIKKNKVLAGFVFMALIAAASIVLCILRGFGGMDARWIFNIGVEILGIWVCGVMYLSGLNDSMSREEDAFLFMTLLMTNACALFLDECSWLVQGIARFAVLNRIVNALFYMNSSILAYLFWRYLTHTLGMEDGLMHTANTVLTWLLIPDLIIRLLNIFTPVYFTVDADGFYARGRFYWLSLTYALLVMAAVVAGLIRSRASGRQKRVAVSFFAFPVINQLLTGWALGISTLYASTLLSVVLIYGVLLTERGRILAATDYEMSMAAKIQADRLPSDFPAFPDRKDFDIFASMDPAREVGGDFYDFFLIDENRLCLVIADVSGKGVPAALFMMSSMNLLQNLAMTESSPAEILRKANDRTCRSNREEMFVTVWLGILDLASGTLTAANAGHEYPVIRRKGGLFEMIRDRHGFVIGGMENVRYRDYTIALGPGDVLFLYTDGLPEATDASKELFGTDRMLASLNNAPSDDPEKLLRAVTADVSAFVGEAPQFDDLTMLCLKYNGGGRAEEN